MLILSLILGLNPEEVCLFLLDFSNLLLHARDLFGQLPPRDSVQFLLSLLQDRHVFIVVVVFLIY